MCHFLRVKELPSQIESDVPMFRVLWGCGFGLIRFQIRCFIKIVVIGIGDRVRALIIPTMIRLGLG